MGIPTLFIGTAYDGPSELQIRATPDSLELFGAYAYERHTLTPTTTSVILSGTPWNDAIDVFYEYYYELLPFYLYNLETSGATATFAKPGVAQDIVFKYLKTPESTDISKYYKESTIVGDTSDLFLMRIAGVKASTTLGTGSSTITITSLYDGAKYNSTNITVTGTTLTIQPPPGTGTSRTYTTTSYCYTLAESIQLDCDKGYLPFSVEYSGTDTLTGLVTTTLTGGSDGTLTASGISALLEKIDISNIGIVSVAGTTWETLSGVITSDYLDDLNIPTMFVLGVEDKSDLITTAEYANTLLASSPNNNNISLTASECIYTPHSGVTYWNNIAPAYCNLLSKYISPTWKGIGSIDFRPNYSTDYMESMALGGYVIATRNVPNNVAIYRAITTDGDWSSLCFLTYRTICSELFKELENVIGESTVDSSSIKAAVDEILSSINTINDYDSIIEVKPGIIFVSITIRIIGELRTISFQVGVNTNV